MPDSKPNPFESLGRKRSDPSQMFAKISEQTAPDPEPETKPEKKQRAKTGKRSDPDYVQAGVYLPKALHTEVKKRLVGSDQDLSDLVADLLNNWLSD